MKRLVISIILIFSLLFAYSQQKYYCKNAYIGFISETPFITLKAQNKTVVTFINMNSGEVVFGVVMRGFKFKQALAEEHFYENYAETDIFPQAKFKGKILDFSKIVLIDKNEYEVEVEGELTIHGVTQSIKEKGNLIIKKNKIFAKSTFILHPEDYEIKIPTIVRDKIASEIIVRIEVLYEPYID
ncbi:MAG: YceI family protein [Bacteroidota bacterium]